MTLRSMTAPYRNGQRILRCRFVSDVLILAISHPRHDDVSSRNRGRHVERYWCLADSTTEYVVLACRDRRCSGLWISVLAMAIVWGHELAGFICSSASLWLAPLESCGDSRGWWGTCSSFGRSAQSDCRNCRDWCAVHGSGVAHDGLDRRCHAPDGCCFNMLQSSGGILGRPAIHTELDPLDQRGCGLFSPIPISHETLTAALYGMFTVLAFYGARQWREAFDQAEPRGLRML